ncbi:MAG: hypothetical protein JNL51_05895 [Chitinophagaceae bacterium]|nr:hypothetical protein [Chitinophagaceae bacterium]
MAKQALHAPGLPAAIPGRGISGADPGMRGLNQPMPALRALHFYFHPLSKASFAATGLPAAIPKWGLKPNNAGATRLAFLFSSA